MRADFYVLSNDKPQIIWLVACSLLEQAYVRGHTVFVFCEHAQDSSKLDELLWTYNNLSFIPHNIQGEPQTPAPAIQIGCGPEPDGFNDILLNLSTKIPPFFMRFQRILEIVAHEEHAKALSRQHYKTYSSKKITMHTHNVGITSQ